MKVLISFALFIFFVFFIVSLFKRLFGLREQQKVNKVLQSVYNTGKISHRNRVYSVREICNCSPYGIKKNGIPRYLVVCKMGDTQIFKLAIEDAEPYDNAPSHHRSFLYK